uniref:Uncharacterized protein n=1 Tax=Globisporangium ultimum (strain ATCC 200006 / CBS 805.95 / DAOM BR144) TaxID=431595 RepID=K3XCY0_GLOUD
MVERLIGKSFIFQIYFNSLILAQINAIANG